LDQPAPVQILTELAHGHIAARCLHLIADFGVADVLGDRPATAADLAARTGTNADALDRMLRLLAAHGVFAREPAGYVHTAASRLLRGEGAQSLRSYVRMIGMPAIWRGFTDLGHAAKTGGPAVDWASLIAYFAAHPDESSLFNEAMMGKSLAVVPAVVAAYDFKRFATIADIGGGRGHLLQAILDNTPNASGVLFELPHVIADAREVASPRLRLMAGDFFTDGLPAVDAYILMEVLHDWADTDAKQILAGVRRAAPKHAHLLIVESLVSASPGPHFGNTLDIIMLAVTGGRERTRAEYERLLADTGFHLERIIATPTRYDIVEAVAV
jgi:hypothetical protein